MKVKPAKAKKPSVPPSKARPKAAKGIAKGASPKTANRNAGVTKAAAKSVSRAPAKPAAQGASRTAAKPVSRPVAKAARSGASSPAATGRNVAAKPKPKTNSSTATQPAIKPSRGHSGVGAKPKAGNKPEINVQPKTASRPAPAPVPASPPPPAAPVSTIVQRPGRPSSRLASLTVPSMAQSVASTAAKASYSQLAAAPLIVPPAPAATQKDPRLANNWKTKPAEQLTDAELLAMPDSEYMNDKQMAAFRLKLSLLKQEILNSAGETTEHLREDTVVVPDPADRATIEEEHALELRTRDRERKLLKKIEQSIMRIDAGDYGYCDETGEAIGVGRLLARPTATLSLEAQQRRELKQKMFGD